MLQNVLLTFHIDTNSEIDKNMSTPKNIQSTPKQKDKNIRNTWDMFGFVFLFFIFRNL